MFEVDLLPSGYGFHHIGYATTSIERELRVFASLGYVKESVGFIDPVQGVSGCFLTGPGPRIELLEPLQCSQTIMPWINAGIKMYHLAYSVENIGEALEWARRLRAKVVVEPVPAVAFEMRRIAFVMLRNGLLIEFVEN